MNAINTLTPKSGSGTVVVEWSTLTSEGALDITKVRQQECSPERARAMEIAFVNRVGSDNANNGYAFETFALYVGARKARSSKVVGFRIVPAAEYVSQPETESVMTEQTQIETPVVETETSPAVETPVETTPATQPETQPQVEVTAPAVQPETTPEAEVAPATSTSTRSRKRKSLGALTEALGVGENRTPGWYVKMASGDFCGPFTSMAGAIVFRSLTKPQVNEQGLIVVDTDGVEPRNGKSKCYLPSDNYIPAEKWVELTSAGPDASVVEFLQAEAAVLVEIHDAGVQVVA